jgi:Fanconi anemia group M protein
MKTIKTPLLLDIFSKKKSRLMEEEPKEKIIVDYREKNSLVASYLIKQGFEVEFKELKIGDYLVKDVIIERKTVQDFISSMINHRLINQIEELKQYENKLLIIEGISEQELYREENTNINPNAIRGFLLSILLSHKIPLIFSKNSEDTAKFINVLSKRKNKEINLNAKKKTLNKKEQLQFIIESFPGIGPKKAKKLLEKFGSIQNIITASTEDLKDILGVQAENIREIIERKY